MSLTLTIKNTDALQPGGRKELVLTRRGGIIGRANVNDWWLPDPRNVISSDHCEIEYDSGFYFLHDISRNGTFLNGARTKMVQARRIEPGDEFRIGHYIVKASLSGEAEAIYEEDQQRRAADASEEELWGKVAAPDPINRDDHRDIWDEEDGGWSSDAEPEAEPDLGDDEWDRLTPAPRAATAPRQKRSVWDEEETVRRDASEHSSAGPDRTPDPSADDIWGRLESDQQIDYNRARIGKEIEENRDPFAGFYDDDPTPPPFAEERARPASPDRRAGDRNDRNLPKSELRSRRPTDDEWDDAGDDSGFDDRFDTGFGNDLGYGRSPPRQRPQPRRTDHGHEREQRRRSAPPRNAARSPQPPEHRHARQSRVQSKAELEHLSRAFLTAAGIDPETVQDWSPAMIDKSGQMLGKLVAGLFVLLEARSRAKSELGAQRTAFLIDGNNPLKFAMTPEQALTALINPPAKGFMGSGQAIDEAFSDLQAHQEATIIAMRGALRASIDKFSPAAIRKTVGEQGMLAKMVPGAEGAELWRAYERAFSGVVKNSDEAFLEAFAREFKAAYERAGNGNRR